MNPTTSLAPLLLFISCFSYLTHAHTRFTTLHINGQSQGDGICIRQDQNPGTTTNFVPSLTGPEVACGIDGTIAHPNTCAANPGDQISLEHRMYPDGSQPGAIDVSHKGNTAVYMKKITDQSNDVTGSGWFKIYWDGYDASTEQWGTDHMNANGGLVTTTIPADLAAGNYLIRSEVLALQELGNPQMYVGCAQVRVSGTGTGVPSENDVVAIPGYIDAGMPAMNINIYQDFAFTEYGPKVYRSGGSGTGTVTASGANGTGGVGISTGLGAVSSAGTADLEVEEIGTVNTSSVSDGDTMEADDDDGEDDENDGEEDDDDDDDDNADTSDIGSDKHRVGGGGGHQHHNGKPDVGQHQSNMTTGWHSWNSWNNAHRRAHRRLSTVAR